LIITHISLKSLKDDETRFCLRRAKKGDRILAHYVGSVNGVVIDFSRNDEQDTEPQPININLGVDQLFPGFVFFSSCFIFFTSFSL
jgi:hypothetical protein